MSNLNGSEYQHFQSGNVLPVDKISAINSSQNNFDMVSKQIGGKRRVKKSKKTLKKQRKQKTKKNKSSTKRKQSKNTMKKRIMKIFRW